MEQTKYDVFISYSRKDYVDEHGNVIPGNEVSKIMEALTNAGISYWFDQEGIYSGQNFVEKIVTNIENAKIFVFLSTANANKSPWTCREIASADELKKHIIPVRIDSSPYNKKVLFRIADLDYIEYYANPQKGIEDLIKSVKSYLDEFAAEERRKKEEQERKRLEEEKRLEDERQKKILQEQKIKKEQESIVNDIELRCTQLNNEESKLELDRTNLLLTTERVVDQEVRDGLKEKIVSSSPIRKKVLEGYGSLQEDFDKLISIKNALEKENVSLKSQVSDLQSSLAKMKNDYQKCVSQLRRNNVDELNEEIKKLEEKLKKAERVKNTQTQTLPPKKKSKKSTDNEMDATTWIILGIIVVTILLNLIAPWFIPSIWPKIAVIFTVLGTCVVIKALEDDSNKKIFEILGWCGAIAILLSTILTIYGICGGFSPNKVKDSTMEVDEGGKEMYIHAVTDDKTMPNGKLENITLIKDSVAQEAGSKSAVQATSRIPKDFVLVPAGTLKDECEWHNDREVVYNVSIDSFYICKYELTQAEYKRIVGTLLPENYTWNIQIDYKDAVVVQQGDSIPVVGTYQEFAEYCNRRSKMEGYGGFYEIDGNQVKIRHDGNGYRLLNHFEWTYAAKGGNANERYSYAGSNKIGEVAWYGGNSKYRPHIVGKKKANSLGLYDMSGNAREMLQDDPKYSYHPTGGAGFEYWILLGAGEISGMYKNERAGTRIALIPKSINNNNTRLTWKYKW